MGKVGVELRWAGGRKEERREKGREDGDSQEGRGGAGEASPGCFLSMRTGFESALEWESAPSLTQRGGAELSHQTRLFRGPGARPGSGDWE